MALFRHRRLTATEHSLEQSAVFALDCGPRRDGKRHGARGTLSSMLRPGPICRLAPVFVLLTVSVNARAAEHITLSTGFDLVCAHRVAEGAKTRLYFDSGSTNYLEVDTASIAADELLPDPPAVPPPNKPVGPEVLTPSELHEMLLGVGAAHDLDVDLLASVVHAESGARVHARSRAGAQGLMQLMPGTAAELGVHDPFAPKENVSGGAAYLDALLRRYHNNVAWALAAYNAGPGAVDRWHGIPPYRETRLYVARIIHEFNRRYAARETAASLALAAK